jgi:SpoVK/Ycf46/Vps4 family AAA+-type ATPase
MHVSTGNRVHGGVNFTTLAERLEGYTGSDIKEVCREAVVRVAHERAQLLEHGGDLSGSGASASSSAVKAAAGANSSNGAAAQEESDFNAPLRAVTMEDFQAAMKKLKASVNDNGLELQKVVEWNNKYGEFKRKGSKASSTAQMTMYV